MRKVNKGKKLLAMLLATALLLGLFPAVCAEESPAEIPEEYVTPTEEETPAEVTVEEPAPVAEEVPVEIPAEEPVEIPAEEPVEIPAEVVVEEPAPVVEEVPVEIPAEEPAEVPAEAPAEEPAEAPVEEPVPEPVVIEVDPSVLPAPEAVNDWDPSDEEEEELPAEEVSEEPVAEDDAEEELFEFDDDDQGFVSEELLEQFNTPDAYDRIEFNGTADIVLKEDTFSYGQTVTLQAQVSGVELSYRLVWEAFDDDERGWYTVGSGMEYTFVVTPEIMGRGYRVVLFAVD